MIGLEGVGNTDGIVIDHVYIHDNDYSLQPSSENFWAEFSTRTTPSARSGPRSRTARSSRTTRS
jgi:hypothetical protein